MKFTSTMKTRLTLIIFALLFLNLTNSKAFDRVKTGKQITRLLQSIQTWDESTYEKYMATPEDILEKILDSDNNAIKTKASESVVEARESWSKELDKEFKRICRQGEELEINWKKIKFKDFTYEPEKVGIKDIYKGKLIFSYNNKSYSIKIGFLTIDEDAKIGELEYLREYNE